MTFRWVLTSAGTTFEPSLPYSHQQNIVAETIIRTTTEKAQAMMVDSKAPIQVWGEAVNTAVYLHQRSPNEGVTIRDDQAGYKALYETPYLLLDAFSKPAHDGAGNKLSY